MAHASAFAATLRGREVLELKGKRFPFGTVAICLICVACACAASASAAGLPDLKIRVLSNRADVISGGDALVAVKTPRGVRPGQIRMKLNGRDVTDEFAVRANGRYEGRLDGLRMGRNVLRASAPGADADTAVIRNHSIGGPVFSGP